MDAEEARFERARKALALARARNARIACAESCTGGLVAAALTEVPGSSDAFAGGVVSYMLDVKEHVLGVSPDILYTPSIGAVSSECAIAMAQGVCKALRADVAVSVTGIAGPGGEEPGKPVGTVWFGWSAFGDSSSQCLRFDGDRASVRAQACLHALGIICEVLA